MNSSIFPSLMAQLAGQLPVLIVYVVGIVLALVYWRRCPSACLFTLIAMAVLLVTAVAQSFLNVYVVQMRGGRGWTVAQVGTIYMVSSLAGSILRAAAMGLVLAAVFVGRQSTQAPGFPVLPPR